jgi:hypothetical protein
MKPKTIIYFFLVIFNSSIFAQDKGALLVSYRDINLKDNGFSANQTSNLIPYNVDKQLGTRFFINKKNGNDRVGQTLLVLVPTSFLMGTISAFDQGFNSETTIAFYSISLASGIGLYINVHKKKRRR